MKNNKLTLKALKQELELLKTNSKLKSKVERVPKIQEIDNLKNNHIQNLFMKSSMFYMWLITGILGYAQKIPFIGRIVTLLSLYYGRTTIWKVLVKLRKLFITFNAIIGMYMVYKTTGYGVDTLYCYIASIGTSYVEIFINFNKRVFNWLVNLLDHKIVPNVPKNPPSSAPKWWPGLGTNNVIKDYSKDLDTSLNKILPDFSLRELYAKNPNININFNTPWYKDLSTYLWLGGIVCSIGATYLGYKFITDPSFILGLPLIGNYFKTVPSINIPSVSPTDGSNSPTDIVPVASTSTTMIDGTKSLVSNINNKLKMLNPMYWLPLNNTIDHDINIRHFELKQASVNYDSRYYPFTSDHPFAPFLDKLRLSIIGESYYERTVRLDEKRYILQTFIPKGASSTSTPIITSVTNTPSIATIGLGIDTSQLWNKISSLPPTPTMSPTHLSPVLPEMSTNWVNNTLDNTIEVTKEIIKDPITDIKGKGKLYSEVVKPLSIDTKPISITPETGIDLSIDTDDNYLNYLN